LLSVIHRTEIFSGEAEKILTDDFTTSSVNDISALFVERQLRLLGDRGTFGNITTLRLVYQSSLQDLHDFIRDRFSQMDIACFAHRPQQVFPNAIVRVAILTGQQTNPDDSGSIRTSKFLQFNKENRKEVFDSIEFRSVEGLELREQIGGDDRSYEVLPKVGVGRSRTYLRRCVTVLRKLASSVMLRSMAKPTVLYIDGVVADTG